QRAQQVVGHAVRVGAVHVSLSRDRYVTLGSVPRSSSSLLPRGDRDSRDTSLSGSSRSPKTSARPEHDSTHAGLTSPSLSWRFPAFPSICAAAIRWTQNVHFSITPTSRTETSGLSCTSSGRGHCGLKKSKKRTLYGHAFAQ